MFIKGRQCLARVVKGLVFRIWVGQVEERQKRTFEDFRWACKCAIRSVVKIKGSDEISGANQRFDKGYRSVFSPSRSGHEEPDREGYGAEEVDGLTNNG
ncbi:hypothetical protein U1Q18_004933 [Sarracenia purpurea var. burkii]